MAPSIIWSIVNGVEGPYPLTNTNTSQGIGYFTAERLSEIDGQLQMFFDFNGFAVANIQFFINGVLVRR